jgi:hypothetical protein
MRNLLSLFFGATVLVLAAGACSSSSSSSTTTSQCNTDPFTCAAGTTCWPTDTAADFACIKSGAGKAGDSCLNTPNAATCGDGFLCLQQTQTDGHCVPYCDTSHGCPTGQACTAAQIIGTTQVTHVCFGTTPAGTDGGTDASAGEDANGGKDSATGGDLDGGTD